jgi:hypothetical protein
MGRIDEATHAGHAMFRAARDGVAGIDRQHGVVDAFGSERAAAALAASAQEAGLDRISHVLLGHDRQRLFAVDTVDLHSPLRRIAYVDVVPAREQTIEASTQRFDSATARQTEANPVREHTPAMEPAHEVRARSLAH